MLFDLLVIGSGPAGKSAALESARAGAKTALIEAMPSLGGGCVHESSIPSKAFREAVLELGRVPMKKLLARRDEAVTTEAGVVTRELKDAGVTIVHGRARLVSPNDVEVTTSKGLRHLTATQLILAVGASPRSPDSVRVDGRRIHDSNTILGLQRLPARLVVLGGGIVGCEYASIFAHAGTRVTLVDRRQEVLASVDREIVRRLTDRLERGGAEILLETEAQSIRPRANAGVAIRLTGGSTIQADAVLIAQGRYGNTEALGLEAAGVECDERGLIPVDSAFRTNIGHIFAVGDVIGPPAFASTAIEEGKIAARTALRLPRSELPVLLPYVIFTVPEISMVGRTEDDLRDSRVEYVAGRADFRELPRGRLRGGEEGMLKLLVEPRTHRILGVHLFGHGASELIHLGQAAMALGADVHYFTQAVFNYPTLSEAYRMAAARAVGEIRS
ncbi:MAG: Si-specific NAD(P)(+) transhydrogenase [Oligoflexia bacterium]|nr:Si-specific NAD(P)(+) transhydrogenase [Oligoflexia bacterium]